MLTSQFDDEKSVMMLPSMDINTNTNSSAQQGTAGHPLIISDVTRLVNNTRNNNNNNSNTKNFNTKEKNTSPSFPFFLGEKNAQIQNQINGIKNNYPQTIGKPTTTATTLLHQQQQQQQQQQQRSQQYQQQELTPSTRRQLGGGTPSRLQHQTQQQQQQQQQRTPIALNAAGVSAINKNISGATAASSASSSAAAAKLLNFQQQQQQILSIFSSTANSGRASLTPSDTNNNNNNTNDAVLVEEEEAATSLTEEGCEDKNNNNNCYVNKKTMADATNGKEEASKRRNNNNNAIINRVKTAEEASASALAAPRLAPPVAYYQPHNPYPFGYNPIPTPALAPNAVKLLPPLPSNNATTTATTTACVVDDNNDDDENEPLDEDDDNDENSQMCARAARRRQQQQQQQQQAAPTAAIPTAPSVAVTVVFDLDETLVYNRRLDINYALLRPYALHLLNALRVMPGVELVLWTASTRETAEPVIHHQLHSRGIVFHHVIYRDDRWFNDPMAHTKDLRLLGRDMDRVLIVDNQPNCCKLNPTNAVLVEDYVGGEDEAALSDASLVNLYYIVDVIVQNMAEKGWSVGRTLQCLSDDEERCSSNSNNNAESSNSNSNGGGGGGGLCRYVRYDLPNGWMPCHIQLVKPLCVPAHGTYVRALATSPAPLDSWTR